MAQMDINLNEVAEAICKGVLHYYAVPGKLPADENPNEWGIQVSFGNKKENEAIIRFQFVTEKDYLLEVQVDAIGYVVKPTESIYRMHNDIRLKINEMAESETPLVIMTKPPIELAQIPVDSPKVIH